MRGGIYMEFKDSEKRIAKQFFVDRKSVEFLADQYKVSKKNVIHCITGLQQQFASVVTPRKRVGRYRVNY